MWKGDHEGTAIRWDKWFTGSASKKCLWSDYKVITHNKIATISCVALYMSTIGVLIAAERMTQIPTDTSSHIPQQQWLHHAWPIWTGCSTAGSKGGVRPLAISSDPRDSIIAAVQVRYEQMIEYVSPVLQSIWSIPLRKVSLFWLVHRFSANWICLGYTTWQNTYNENLLPVAFRAFWTGFIQSVDCSKN